MKFICARHGLTGLTDEVSSGISGIYHSKSRWGFCLTFLPKIASCRGQSFPKLKFDQTDNFSLNLNEDIGRQW